MIRAEAHSDDFVVTAKFDATPWFKQASEEEIMDLARCEWGGDYPADAVADYLESEPGYDSLAAMFEYLGKHPKSLSNEAIGFEVHVHRDDAYRWLLANRKDVFNEVAVIDGIDADEEKSISSTDPTSPGWDSDSSWIGDYDLPKAEATPAP